MREYSDDIGMACAKTLSKYAQCKSRQIGAVIMYADRIIGMGCNGAIVKEPCGICPRAKLFSGEGLKNCQAIHAEVMAICDAAKSGQQTYGATMYITCGVPCKDCYNAIVAAGIKRVVCDDARVFYDTLSREFVENGKVTIVTYEPGPTILGGNNWLEMVEDSNG